MLGSRHKQLLTLDAQLEQESLPTHVPTAIHNSGVHAFVCSNPELTIVNFKCMLTMMAGCCPCRRPFLMCGCS
jgi:hypothetical protein